MRQLRKKCAVLYGLVTERDNGIIGTMHLYTSIPDEVLFVFYNYMLVRRHIRLMNVYGERLNLDGALFGIA